MIEPANQFRSTKESATCRRLLFAFALIALHVCPALVRADADAPPPTSTRPAPLVATDGPVRVAVFPPAGDVVSGEPFEIDISIETVEGVQVAPPEFGDIFGIFEIENVERADGDCAPPAACLTIKLTLVGYFAGNYAIPSVPMLYYDDRQPSPTGGRDAEARQFNTPEVPLDIKEGLADLRGPVAVALPVDWWMVAYIVGIVAALGIIVWLARRFWPAPKAAAIAPLPPPLPAYAWALHAFQHLEAENLVAAGRIKAYYFGVNGILRGYIEREFGFNAGEQTSEEFVRSLQDDPRFSSTQRELLRAFIDACDPVKYAAQTPAPDEISWVQKTARDFVERTHASREAERQAALQRQSDAAESTPARSEAGA